ncbi:putative serine protease [Alphaspiravirus yamagawaense]|uniref:Putative serine protease n=1 Tax=Alphaspiravirus yamagawaense TaxID=1157339 RepID=J7Q326_9VIRU|nr:putative serine protease [Aeropyrum coil-shaped virus]CCG27838.1 putative serine protease [Aeropyrum coil-shaped virus]
MPRKEVVAHILEKRRSELLSKPNVVGYSNVIQKRIRRGRVVDEPVIRVYVKKKLPRNLLRPQDLVPEEVEGIRTDVVEIGEVEAWALLQPRAAASPLYTGRYRPVIAGVSIGHYQITAGTLGWYVKAPNAEILFASNAHVFTPNASGQEGQYEGDPILQPGPYDGGRNPDDKVAEYVWHKRVVPEGEGGINHIDFAVARPVVDYLVRNYHGTQPVHAIGLLFAGSSSITVVCKCKHIYNEGYRFIDFTGAEMKCVDPLDDEVTLSATKEGRTTGYHGNIITDESAAVRVNYGGFTAYFEDVIFFRNPFGQPGDSGSFVFIPDASFD